VAIDEVCAYVFVLLTESFLLLTSVLSSIWVAAAAFVCLTVIIPTSRFNMLFVSGFYTQD